MVEVLMNGSYVLKLKVLFFHFLCLCMKSKEFNRAFYCCSHKHQRYSRAYIEFKRPEDVFEFAEFFDGHVFVNEKGNVMECIRFYYVIHI